MDLRGVSSVEEPKYERRSGGVTVTAGVTEPLVGKPEEAIGILVRLTPWLWVIAIAGFGVGDTLTTLIGLETRAVIEVSPVAATLVGVYGLEVLPLLKLGAFAVCFGLWWIAPRPSNVGVPLALAVLGVGVTLWNLGVLWSSTPAFPA